MATLSVAFRTEPASKDVGQQEIAALARETSEVEGMSLSDAAKIAALQVSELIDYAHNWDDDAATQRAAYGRAIAAGVVLNSVEGSRKAFDYDPD